MTRSAHHPATALKQILTAALAACAAVAANAETSPYYIGAQQGFTSDSNITRVSESTGPRSDVISSTGLFGGFDQPIGRQRLSGNLSTNLNRYRHNSQLNNTDVQGLLRLDWSTINHLSGELQATRAQDLYHPDTDSASIADQKIILRRSDAFFQARLGVVTEWTLEAGVAGSTSRYSAEALRNSDVDQASYNVGVRFRPSDLIDLGLKGRHADIKYPHALSSSGAEVNNKLKREDVDLTAAWSPTGNSTLRARLSHSKWDYSLASYRDSVTTTGALSYDWHPAGRTALTLSLLRDSDVGNSSFENPLVSSVSTATKIATTAKLDLRYELTGKIRLGSHLQYARRNLDNSLTETVKGSTTDLPSQAEDRTSTVGLSVSYAATRSVSLSCNIAHSSRSISDDNVQPLTYPYRDNTATCSASLTLNP